VADFKIKTFDRRPKIRAVLKEPDPTVIPQTNPPTMRVVDLTDAIGVDFILRPDGGGVVKVNSPADVIAPPTGGVVEYDWAAGDTDTQGTFKAEWEVTWEPGITQTFPTDGYNLIEIGEDLDGA
jgi:hypothetical protein